jgi:hypothetical protein
VRNAVNRNWRRGLAQAVSIGRVNEFLKQAGGLVKIEDILPLFPDFVQIDNFKEAICESLEEYNAQIERLKLEMADATRIADALRSVCHTALFHGFSFSSLSPSFLPFLIFTCVPEPDAGTCKPHHTHDTRAHACACTLARTHTRARAHARSLSPLLGTPSKPHSRGDSDAGCLSHIQGETVTQAV